MNRVIIKNIKQKALSEIGQSSNTYFTLLEVGPDDVYTNLTPMIKCRDFFSDLIYAQYNKLEKFGCYGFYWDYYPTLDKQLEPNKYIPILVSVPEGTKENVDKYYQLIHKFEELLGINKTAFSSNIEIDTTFHKNSTHILVPMPSEWLANSINISLYTLLWRLITYDIGIKVEDSIEQMLDDLSVVFSKLKNRDSGLIKDIHTNKEYLLKYLKNWKLLGFAPQPQKEAKVYNIHDGSGIVSFLVGISDPEKKANPCIREWCKLIKELN